MRYGSVPRSIAKWLDEAPVESYNAPDGLNETAINILISEAYSEFDEAALRQPSSLATDIAEKRRNRRTERRVLRALPPAKTSYISFPATDGEAA
ncbi:hypothetical protein F1721_06940 [Saccharopolyspora hirsuta]|uniref:Uncharacterized protein n=1 Tax=Saccharopolyspora hirsuta TaxID=1837 RepID=A0A5M7C704_SACHI|nr:hypothetical protein [Saccharopolyspora hirsuta]KAA5836068.1 hypothetical protein F1721_06940 [Saccharopolyspora hirsuta]